jgi:hypothetical protein
MVHPAFEVITPRFFVFEMTYLCFNLGEKGDGGPSGISGSDGFAGPEVSN